MSNEWRNDLPPKEGYYEAKFGANDTPAVLYLHPFKAGEITGIDEDFISWGWDDSDDPESVEVECERSDFWWREIQPTLRAVDPPSALPSADDNQKSAGN